MRTLRARLSLCLLGALAVLALSAVPASALYEHNPLFQITTTPNGPPPSEYALVDSGDLWVSGHIEGTRNFAVERFNATSGAFISSPLLVDFESNHYHAIAIGHPVGGEPELYVDENAGVGLFSEAGASLGGAWTGTATPAHSFSAVGIAVDDSALDWAAGDVYIADQSNNVVDVFHPEADHKEDYVTQLTGTGLAPTSPTPSEPFTHLEAITVNDLNGDVVVEDNGKLDVFEPTILDGYTFVQTLTPPSGASFKTERYTSVSADDSEGDIYITGLASGKEVVFEYGAAGEYLGDIEPNTKESVRAVAGDQETPHGLFVVFGEAVQAYGPNIVVPDVTTAAASSLKGHSVTLEGTVNPDGEGEAKCQFDWGTSPSFGSVAPCEPEGVVEGSSPVPVHAALSGLHAGTTYYYRLQASNSAKGANPGGTNAGEASQDQRFRTPGPEVGESWSTGVRSTSATMHGEIDPHGVASSYFLQYGRTTAYEDGDVPASPGASLGSGEAPVQVEQHIQGLTAGQEYHYRMVAVGEVGGELIVEESPDHTFTTQIGGEAGLPDGREWVLVSPPDKLGASLIGATSYTFVQAAADGDGIVYGAAAPTEAQPRGNGEGTQVLSSRGGGPGISSWSSVDLLTPHTIPTSVTPNDSYRLFSSDLSVGALQPEGGFEPALSGEATEQTPYLHDNTTGAFTPLVTHPGDDTSEPFVPFGGEEENAECKGTTTNFCPPNIQGATPDLSHIILGGGVGTEVAPLLKGAPADALYEWSGGGLSLVSQLPSVNPPEVNGDDVSLGGAPEGTAEVFTHAISEDGSRVFWHEQATSRALLLFMRDMARGETIEIGTGEAQFEGANANGTLVFYSGKECGIVLSETGLECEPVLGENGKPLEDGLVLATSEDGSIVYFKSGENIYVRHGKGGAKLIASNIGDIRSLNAESGGGVHPQQDPWRASPNGEWFAFMSNGPLTGYDNRDAVTGVPDEEVYLYSAAAERLVCASCDPTGARPHGTTGLNLNRAQYGDDFGEERSLAATIPGWGPYTLGKALYDPRFLADSGRLFFNATDGLVPKDVNGQVDVYELEPPGEGSCTTGTQTGSDIYVPSAAGCVALISSGESDEESVFEDASETGEDVFFLSSSRLSTADLDGSLSVWDAQVCTSSVPCPAAPVSPPPCDTEASCKVSPTPQPTIYQAPASATFNGPGNVTVQTPAISVKKVTKKAVRCKKGLVRNAKGKCVKKSKGKARKARRSARGSK